MKRAISIFLLALFALLAISPIIFLAAGAFMGNQEIMDAIGPVLQDRPGHASWKLLPRFPTLKNLVQLLLDSPEFFQMFWNSVKITGGILAGQLLFGTPAAWGLARYSFGGNKEYL